MNNIEVVLSMNILLLAGGWSSEREVSLRGAESIKHSLEELGHSVRLCDIAHEFSSLISLLETAEFAFINIHGKGGEDGLLPALVERCGIPYQCSNAQSSFLSLNKAMTKALYKKYGLPTPLYMLYTALPSHISLQKYPLFVKENMGGSSLGLYRVDNEKEAIEAIEAILSCGDCALVEESITGVEVTCGILGERALPPVLITPHKGIFFTYESKYEKNAAEELCPAPLPDEQNQIIMEYAQRAHTALELFGYSRTDMMVQEDGSIFLLETNTIPGMTTTSLLPKEAHAVGISFTELVDILVKQGIERHSKKA